MATSAAVCLLKACSQAGVSAACQSLVRCANQNFVVRQVSLDMCAFKLLFRKRISLIAVNVPAHMNLDRRCDNHGNVCTFPGLLHRQLGILFQSPFHHQAQRVRFAIFAARLLVHRKSVGIISNAGWDESRPETQMVRRQVAVRGLIRAESRLIFAIVLELIAEQPRTQQISLATMDRCVQCDDVAHFWTLCQLVLDGPGSHSIPLRPCVRGRTMDRNRWSHLPSRVWLILKEQRVNENMWTR